MLEARLFEEVRAQIGAQVERVQKTADAVAALDVICSFAEVAAYAGRGEIADEVYTEAVVISDCSSANMELNPSISYNKVDTDENSRTAYVQALDASSGFRLKFVNPSDNLLVHGTVVSLSLYGTTVEKDERTES